MMAVHKNYFLTLDQLQHWPESQIGELGHHLGKLASTQVRIAPSLVVPQETLLAIAEVNHFDHQLLAWVHQLTNNPLTAPSLGKLIHQLHIPDEIAQTFLTNYYQTFAEYPVSVVASWLHPQHSHLLAMSDEVSGDVNAFHALLDTWAQSLELSLQNAFIEQIFLDQVVPAALLLQANLQPVLKGTITTETEIKSIYQLDVEISHKKRSGIATLLIDVRTWKIIKVTLPDGISASYLSEQLPMEEALEIAQLAYRIKLHELHQLRISWEKANGQIYISNVEKVSEVADRAATIQVPDSHCLALGSPAVRGSIQAQALVMDQPPSDKQTFEHRILVTPKINYLSLNNLIGLDGVVVEQDLPWSVHQLLQQHHIPTIARARRATITIKNGQSILLDTETGKIWQGTSAHQKKTLKPVSKTEPHHVVAAWVADSFEQLGRPLSSTTTVIFNLERWWLETGHHPHHLLKTGQSRDLENQLTRLMMSYRHHSGQLVFRPSTFRSDQLRSLNHSFHFETEEPNPALGFRGAVRLLQQPSLLNFELHIMAQIQKISGKPIAILIPETRTLDEVTRIIDVSEAQGISHFWWEMAFPINLDQASQLPKDKIEKIIVKTDQLLSYYQGLDRYQPDLLASYPREIAVLQRLLGKLIATTDHRKILLDIRSDFQKLTDASLQAGLSGVAVPIQDLYTAQNVMLAAEHQLGQH